ncbi:ribosomal RNA small subunit methyltransferase G [Bacteroidia bacterium]|nr:ribosomal RNA small subunit methyltransferase G [Bacteroidia bacterium]
MDLIKKYFPEITARQEAQFDALYDLYADWNSKINLISRKDIENLYEKHILHSLGIAEVIRFKAGTTVLDVGTGGGFPGIPLAILFPESSFLLIDRIGKKIKVAEEVARQTGLANVICRQIRAEEEKTKVDFVVSRAVMPLGDLVHVAKKTIRREQHNALPNGFLCLKGGDLQAEIQLFKNKTVEYDLSDFFEEEFFKQKKVIYLPI